MTEDKTTEIDGQEEPVGGTGAIASEFGDFSKAVPKREGSKGHYTPEPSGPVRPGSMDHKNYKSKGFRC